MSNKLKLKTKEDIQNLRYSGRVLAQALAKMVEATRPGISTKALDDIAYKYIKSIDGCEPALLNYKPYGADYPFPASICISVNEAVVHGIPDDYELVERDVVSYDGCVKYKGMISDSALTVIVTSDGCITIKDILKKVEDYNQERLKSGNNSQAAEMNEHKLSVLTEAEQLLYVTYKSMWKGIDQAKIGNNISHISKAIENYISKMGEELGSPYGIVKSFSGHGVGYHVHEEPYVPNYDDGEKGPRIDEGLVLAIEPMVTLGTDEIEIIEDGYTALTIDGSIAAHFEHTVVAGKDGGEVLTQ